MNLPTFAFLFSNFTNFYTFPLSHVEECTGLLLSLVLVLLLFCTSLNVEEFGGRRVWRQSISLNIFQNSPGRGVSVCNLLPVVGTRTTMFG